ncbi:MAG: spore germination protein GerW family protein [Methanomicrobiales archaeon]|nr:spore germination protein GerW family protein [Methanomicrobiales archaeon]
MPGEEMLKTTTEILGSLLCASNIMGPPVEAENKVIIPIAGYGFGFGGGDGRSGANSGGSGTGAGAALNPTAIVVLHKDVRGREGVQLLSLRKLSPLAEAVSETIPIVVETIPKVMEQMRGTVRDVAHEMRGPASEAAQAAREAAQEMKGAAGGETGEAEKKVETEWEEWKK